MTEIQKLEKLLDKIGDVPELRRNDLQWLARNLLISDDKVDERWQAHQQVLKILRHDYQNANQDSATKLFTDTSPPPQVETSSEADAS